MYHNFQTLFYDIICISFADYHMFQYFIQVVPTKVATGQANRDTYQYAVTEKVSA